MREKWDEAKKDSDKSEKNELMKFRKDHLWKKRDRLQKQRAN